ncbi:Tubulin-specific chaperone D (Beta-tubulin cofactor D) (Tubulin-folding cofactor D) [Durusdinium trenchii]|uniref:Tubulin-specific chaperone D (Beta-tubulin cofactor D) (Tubulin-folding cofactor D) n=1 Tax=Durusdinium trenchii TaxID=1381693 RepID=A0ABP0R1J2_9DINO
MELSHRELLITKPGATGKIAPAPSAGAGFARSESHLSSSSAIIIEAEACRQRYKRLHPKDCADDEKDYKTLVHTLTQERLSAIFKTKMGEGACKTGLCGLKEEQARVYFNVYGKNEITPPKRENIWIKLLRQTFLGIFNILLWSCVVAEVALIVIFSGSSPGAEVTHLNATQKEAQPAEEGPDYVTPIILSAVIVMAALLQWYSELKAESQMEAMQKLQAASKVPTVRMDHGRRVDLELDPVNLVPGDIIFLQAGDRIPADVRILHCTDGTEVDNSALTGESMPEPRHNKTEPVTCPPPEARNLAFFGTTVLKGNATCLIHATGDATFLGKIAQGIKSSRVKSTLEIQIEHFVHIIAVVAICVGLLSLLANLLSPVKRGPAEILQNSAAALFAQVPEGLLPTVTISLMIASDQMASRNVIVRKIDAVETLGCVSVFCSDKTGTLTTGEMAVQDLVVQSPGATFGLEVHNRDRDSSLFKSQPALEEISMCGVLNNGAEFKVEGKEERWTGSPTEVAILRACAEVQGGPSPTASLKQKSENFKCFEIPFNSENKWMLTIHGDQNNGYFAILKGAPERVMKYTTLQSDPSIVGKVEQQLQDLMGQGRRVLCIAKRSLEQNEIPMGAKFEGTNDKDCNFPMKDFKFVGLYGIEDPPKKGVAEAVVDAQKAGVKVVMVTGDHPDTARAIASRINILGSTVETPSHEAEQLQGATEFSVITGARQPRMRFMTPVCLTGAKGEIEEVREALKKAVDLDVPMKTCKENCERIGQIWSQYQEQPALLDPFLEEMVEPLMSTVARAAHQRQVDSVRLHLISSLLYLLTTVRGYKTVVRLFPHEAADLEVCLEAAEEEASKERLETWATLYCFTLWLGMVLLTPFDLVSIDSGHESNASLSSRILTFGLKGLRSTSRTRDASAWMLAKFFGRPDVSSTGALQSFVAWTKELWAEETCTGAAFARSGALQAWNQTLKLAPRTVMSGLWSQVLRLVLDGPSGRQDDDFGSSNLRKLRVAVACRAALVVLPVRLAPWRYARGQRSLLVNFARATGAVASQAAGVSTAVAEEEEDEEDAPEEVEEVVELLLTSLSDKDTVVRWAAAKGVGRVTNRLSRDFGDQVLESLLERCFSFRETDKAWHGGCLALAELTRRGLLLPERLPTVIPLVCQALHFEQVSGNYTLGQHVRDAACYVCWAFARAYAPDVLQPFVVDLASALIQVAVFDREINCRRAAAAAVQENVGRQGTFPHGIDVVTIADYWTLSVRRMAYLEAAAGATPPVAPQIAGLGSGGYRKALIEHLVEKKLPHQDMQIRLLSAQALAKLADTASEETLELLNSHVLPRLLARCHDAQSTVQAKHGAVEGAAELVQVMQES